ncbi:DUF4062 domain-containing protein [Burkholderia cenocepacia]|uniref:DUF4062 domain-containing protein n=1 Tax=Burkholderia cenocepacia TaxID=95486 RepID=UPI000F5734E2|nr:DUF4062 domain-containing protein [Burkholderia cenocepacia]MBR8308745.1 DUF4062 domain-containing protein [Burkholderia cenocepacia]RQU98736.1 DUF4062 domain-containing protein [Burkholderia cenocepacia]
MSKPRIFVSSTYYDLKHIRRSIEDFIDTLGYESVLFESGDIPFTHLDPLDQSCYREISACHMLVLIIGGRYGSKASDAKELSQEEVEKTYAAFNSITKNEYVTARDLDIPIFIFVEKAVANEYRTYKENKGNATIKFAHVDSVNIFRLLDDIYFQKRNNLTREFENSDDITSWLRDQWAGLFAMHISRHSTESQLKTLSAQVDELRATSDVLKKYTESIMLRTEKDESSKLISEMERKLYDQRVRRALEFQPVRYLRDHMEGDPSPNEIYAAIESSNTVSEFVKKFKFDDQGKEWIVEGDVPERVANDFKNLKEWMLNGDSGEASSDFKSDPRLRRRNR